MPTIKNLKYRYKECKRNFVTSRKKCSINLSLLFF